MNKEHLIEALHKLEKEIVEIVITIKLENDTHVPDLLTKIRILPSVAVVSQEEKVESLADGEKVQLSVKYLPRAVDLYMHISNMCLEIRKLPGVRLILVDYFNNKVVTAGGKKLAF